jgi:hypothetical protein
MTNRSSYPQSVVVGAGVENGATLPPSNSGHQNAAELLGTLAGDEPSRLTNQLGRYAESEYKPTAVAREDVEERAIDRTTLRAPTEQQAETVRPATELAVTLLSVPGGGLRAVRDVPGRLDRSVDDRLDALQDPDLGTGSGPQPSDSGDAVDGPPDGLAGVDGGDPFLP